MSDSKFLSPSDRCSSQPLIISDLKVHGLNSREKKYNSTSGLQCLKMKNLVVMTNISDQTKSWLFLLFFGWKPPSLRPTRHALCTRQTDYIVVDCKQTDDKCLCRSCRSTVHIGRALRPHVSDNRLLYLCGRIPQQVNWVMDPGGWGKTQNK